MKLKYKPDNEILDVMITSITDEITVFCQEKLAKTINFHDYEWHYDSVEAFNKDWEDYEPKEHWFISEFGKVYRVEDMPMDKRHKKWLKEIGNYFETKEEAEKAVEKLKAWKWLKDKGFRFTDYDYTTYKGKGCGQVFFNDVRGKYLINEMKDYLDLLFGGGE